MIQTKTKEEAALLAAEITANRLRAFPHLRLALPTGNTPLPVYRRLRDLWRDRSLPARQATLVQIDEYAGIAPEDKRSFRYYLSEELGEIAFARRIFWDGSQNPQNEVARAKGALPEYLNYVLLGLGANGHVAFCEPGCPENEDFYLTSLSRNTQERNGVDASEAMTLGISYLLRSQEIVLLVTGQDKADALARAIEGPSTTDIPASLLMQHPKLTIICDRDAASSLQDHKHHWSGSAVLAIGCKQKDGSYSPSSKGRVYSAARMASRVDADVVVLSGGPLPGGGTEAEHMATDFPGRIEIPLLLEEASDRTSRHALLALPMLRALGIKRLLLTTSWWHLPRFWWMHRWVKKEIQASFRPAWHFPLRGMRGQRRLSDEIAAFIWAESDRREAFRWMKKKRGKK